jgi:hypothetical protein
VLEGIDFKGSVNFELSPWLELFLALFAILLGFAAFRVVCWLLWFSFF